MQKLYSNERNNKQNAIVGFEQNRRDKKRKDQIFKKFSRQKLCHKSYEYRFIRPDVDLFHFISLMRTNLIFDIQIREHSNEYVDIHFQEK